ncbi:hypothetical protein MBM_05531 [Drepanopeziza brunnea f. sp. 'multigermtubi' MB_m1]|uniref:AB hydrolase-1 domain-containing protein n=1 Tax=Marssonina brunnea f. sp. multigermtubi (strain MB_m1) TaxID=1072389 RepID=K1WUX5_MARBU|nr:uncharacterized protein MBM_05531 [Drepanopeziza brunnea f. sp. 'multigermtubi' MB_m1]EKD16237.1 hypothetical protein MBM_05531 [Drepanopeziza brunnea f. sp. 'multigermtubi' MB_m1]
MSTEKPTIVIVPGAWQLASGYVPFATQLQEAGLPTEVIAFPSVGGTESPLPGLPEDVIETQKVLTRLVEEGKEVVLLCHSYGGVVGSCSAEGFSVAERAKEGKKGGVRLVVYMAAFMIPKGKSLLDMLGGKPLPWMDVQGEKTIGVADQMHHIIYNDMSVEQAAPYLQQISHSASIVFSTPSTFEPWNNGVKCAYIFCTEDNALLFPIQQAMAAQLGPEPVTWVLKCGHCPYASIPQELAEVVLKAAEVK